MDNALNSPGVNSIPDGWRLVRLEDVTAVNPRRPKINIDLKDPVTFIPMVAVGENCSGIIARDVRQYEGVAKGYTYFQENDVLFAKITPCLQNGKHALATSLLMGFGFGTTEFHVLRARDLIEPSHLFRVITQPANIEKCTRSFTGTAGQQRVQPETLKSLPILLPPLPEQRAIAEVLDSIDEAIEATEAVVAATEQLRDALLHRLLTRGVPGWHSEWKEVRGIGAIPANWDVVRLGEVLASTTYGTNVRLGTDGDTLILRMNNLQNGNIDLSEVRRANLTEIESNKLNLASGDILFNRTNSLALVGKVAVVHCLPNATSFASYLVRLRVQENRANPFWLAVLLASSSCQSRIQRLATPGVSQANINPTSLKSLTIPLPPLSEQDTMSEMLDSVDEAIEQGRAETVMLQSLKASATDGLLTGRVRVGAMKQCTSHL